MTTETQAVAAARDVKMIIGGEQVDAADGQTFDVINPATGQVIARAPLGGPEDVDRAVRAARAGTPLLYHRRAYRTLLDLDRTRIDWKESRMPA